MPFDTEQTSEKTGETGDAYSAMQRKVVSIVGPTASGKTGLGIAVAKALACKGEQAEIINADAYQMYRGMDIGTAKASPEEQAQVRHHLIDIIEPAHLRVGAGEGDVVDGRPCVQAGTSNKDRTHSPGL